MRGVGGRRRSYHTVCTQRAKCLREPGLLIVNPRWPSRYRLSFEMHDMMDGLSLFSGEGPLVFQEWHNQHEHRTILRLGANSHTRTHPFSAYSRSPELREIRHFFQQSHLPHTPTQLTIRVCVCDTRTGKEACVYESQKETDRHCQDAAVGWPVPANSLAVTDHAGTWTCAKGNGAACVPPMRSLFDFTITPVEGEGGEEVSPAHQLYEVHSAQIDPPTNTISHKGIVGLVFLGHVHEVGLLLASLDWV